MNTKRLELHRLSVGDAAIDGLLKGILAGGGMMLYLAVTGMLLGDAPATTLARFSPGGEAAPLQGLAVHLGVSAVYGVIFGLICWLAFWRRRINPAGRILLAVGVTFGLGLWLLAQLILLPGTGSAMADFSVGNLAIAHLLYGGLLGLTVHRLG